MKNKIISQGAEAIIYQKKDKIIKDRIEKKYRIKKLDDSLRKKRTKSEKKLLEKTSQLSISPPPEKTKEKTKITMQFIKGKKLSEHLERFPKPLKICEKIGEQTAKLHDNELIHGDLTTSNMILDQNEKLWFIDFGLGFHSNKLEDKAVDLHLIKQALQAKHFSDWENFWKAFLKGYKKSKNHSKTLERLKKVESRGRYKKKH